MSYVINGTTLALQPEGGQWNGRESIGVDGNGHTIYSGVRSFEMRWGFMSMSEYNELYGLYSALGTTGTATVNLPQYAGSTWAFQGYSGTVLEEPEVGQYFEQYVSDVRLIIVKIRTS